MVLITYDVETKTSEGRKRLRRASKICENFGLRVQNSVFECIGDSGQIAELKHRLEKIIDHDHDSLRFYYLGNNWNKKVDHIGAKPSFDPEKDILMI